MPEFSLARTFRNRGLLLQTGSQFSNSACADNVEEMFVNLHECIDKKDKNIENELKSARTLQKHYVLCGIARIGILSDDINGEVNIA